MKKKAKKGSEHVMIRIPPELKLQLEAHAREIGLGGTSNSGISTLIRIILIEAAPIYLERNAS